MYKKHLSLLIAGILLASCGTRSSSSVRDVAGANPSTSLAAASIHKDPKDILVTENNISDRRYRSLGDISATVSKWTIFDADPTREKVNEALAEKAAALGADAVILIRYGTVGIGMFSWGTLDGNGRAVVFEK